MGACISARRGDGSPPMRFALRASSLALLIGSIALWVGTGSHPGWTRTYVETELTDNVTGLTYRQREDRFVAGVELLGAGVVLSALLFGTSFFFRKPTQS